MLNNQKCTQSSMISSLVWSKQIFQLRKPNTLHERKFLLFCLEFNDPVNTIKVMLS